MQVMAGKIWVTLDGRNIHSWSESSNNIPLGNLYTKTIPLGNLYAKVGIYDMNVQVDTVCLSVYDGESCGV